jgi:TonB family protein
MKLEARRYRYPPNNSVEFRTGTIPLVMTLLAAATIARAQSQIANPQIVTLRLGSDQIGLVKTAEKVSTRLAFGEPVKEIICGDLYDPESGIGAFVVQRLDNDVFIKPVAPRGISNMFVKAGDKGERIYNFSLLIGPLDQVNLIVKVVNATENIASAPNVSKPPESLRVPPPLDTDIKINDGSPSNAIGSVAGVLSAKVSKMAEPEPPPPSSSVKSNSQALKVVGEADTGSDSIGRREVIRRVKPDYPEFARTTGVSGEVAVDITIDDGGKVKSAQAVSGHALLRGAAENAARSWKFSPATSGKGVKPDVTRITFNFLLAKP